MFYKKLAVVGLPIVLRNTLSSFNGFIDNFMVGMLGSDAISSVSIINQILFIFVTTFSGTNAIAGLYTTQYFGVKNYSSVKNVLLIRIIISVSLLLLFSVLIYFTYDYLINLFMTKGDYDTKRNIFNACNEYFLLSFLSLIPFTFTQIFTSTINESGSTSWPMILCLIATLTNIIFNYLLIDGNLGFPKLGLLGASLATFISRFVELLFVIAIRNRFAFLRNILNGLKLDCQLLRSIIVKVIPIFFNEFLFSFSFLVIAQLYSFQSIDNIVIMSITNTVVVFFMNLLIAIGYSSEILIGHQLGQCNFTLAYSYAKKALLFGFFIGIILTPIIIIISYYFPNLYNINIELASNITKCIQAFALNFYLLSIAVIIFYILRSGGKILLLSILDSGYFWLLVIPCQFMLIKLSNLKIFEIYFIIHLLNLVKCVIGIYFIKKKSWINSLVTNKLCT